MTSEFKQETFRFLPTEQTNHTIKQQDRWSFIVYLIYDISNQTRKL